VVADHPAGEMIKIGAEVVSHGRYVTFRMAEVAAPRRLFAEVLWLIEGHDIGRRLDSRLAGRSRNTAVGCARARATHPSKRLILRARHCVPSPVS
jgi:hypothetical protein